jgi:hypothetical protein
VGKLTSPTPLANSGSWQFDGQTAIAFAIPSNAAGFAENFTWEGFFLTPATNKFQAETGIADRLVSQFAFDKGDWTRLAIGLVADRTRRAESMPPYIVMGTPNITRGPGFLGSKYGYLYLTDPEAGPTGLRRPFDVTQSRQLRRDKLLQLLAFRSAKVCVKRVSFAERKTTIAKISAIRLATTAHRRVDFGKLCRDNSLA